MVRAELDKLLAYGIIRLSKSPSSEHVLCVRKKDEMLRLCLNGRRLKSLLVLDSDSVEEIQTIFAGRRDQRYFTELDLTLGSYVRYPSKKWTKTKRSSVMPTVMCTS